MSDQAWAMVKNAMNETVALINWSARDLAPNSPALELSKRIFEVIIEKNVNPSDEALRRSRIPSSAQRRSARASAHRCRHQSAA